MKKVAYSLLMFTLATSAFAQKSMIKEAKNALYAPADLELAKKSIEAAMSNDETSSMPETYYIAGNVYKLIYDDEDKKRMLNQSYDAKKINTSLIDATASYVNCVQLEQIPDAKGKVSTKYDKDIKKAFEKLKNPLYIEGVTQLQKGDYKMSMKLLDTYMSIPNCQIMNDEPIDSTYYDALYYAANAALLAKDNQSAIKYMYELKDANYKQESMVYEWLVNALMTEKDTAKAMEVIAEGLKKHPSNQYMIGQQVNYQIKKGQKEQAIKYLDDAIAANPKSAEYLNVKAGLYLQDKKYDEALDIYKKAMAVDPLNAEAVEGAGESYAVKAVKMDEAADKEKSDAKYKAGRKNAEVEYKNALEYLEKARVLYSSPNKNNLYWLKVIYVRLGDSQKAKEANEEWKKL